ncbi:MAG: glycosyltransferase [Alphaproteobacteria bacterium]|nr:glycosyltransferase [Alphaproteobacteria bacterium]
MKILSCMFSIKQGGLEKVALDYDIAFKNMGFDSTILLNKKFESINEITNNSIYSTKYKRVINPLTYINIIKCINDVNPDLIFLHGNRAIDLVCNKMIKYFVKNKNIKYISTTHNYRSKRFKRLDYCLAISDDLKEHLIKEGISSKKILLCPNAVKLEPIDSNYKFHKTPVLGAFGRLHKVKGYDLLITAFSEIINKGIKAKLIIAGEGTERNKLEKQIKKLNLEKHITIHPWVKDKRKFFKKIDIFCLSSRSEGMPLSLLEAISFSKPFVSTDCPGAVEIYNRKNAGIIVKRENVKQLSAAMEELIINESKAKNMSKKAHLTLKSFYSQEIMEKNLKKVIKAATK